MTVTSWRLEAGYKISWTLASWKRAWRAGNSHKLEGGRPAGNSSQAGLLAS